MCGQSGSALGAAAVRRGSPPPLQSPAAGPCLSSKDIIVVADVANRTGDPVFDGTLREALPEGAVSSAGRKSCSGPQSSGLFFLVLHAEELQKLPAKPIGACAVFPACSGSMKGVSS